MSLSCWLPLNDFNIWAKCPGVGQGPAKMVKPLDTIFFHVVFYFWSTLGYLKALEHVNCVPRTE